MTFDLPNIIGLIGSGLCVIAFAYSNIVRTMNFTIFNLMNLVGSLLLIGSLTVHFNMGAMAMEMAWALIAVIGLARALRKGEME